jgi:hypothetical protein
MLIKCVGQAYLPIANMGSQPFDLVQDKQQEVCTEMIHFGFTSAFLWVVPLFKGIQNKGFCCAL